MKVTFISSLFGCDQFIDKYIENFENMIGFENHKLIITNVTDTNSEETNNKINKFSERPNIKLINILKEQDNGLYDCWNKMIEIIDTELVCNLNADDLVKPQFLELVNEFKKDDVGLICTPIRVINSKYLPIKYWHHKKQIMTLSRKYEDNYQFKFDQYKNLDILKCRFYKTRFTNFDIFDMFYYRTKNRLYIGKNIGYRACNLPGCCPIWKKSLYDKYGGFNYKEFYEGADFELWCRFLSNGVKMRSVDRNYVDYMFRKDSEGNNKEDKRIVEKVFDLYHPINFM